MKITSTKRRRSRSTSPSYSKRQKQYSTRDIPWTEQLALGGDFAAAGFGSWPIDIIDEKGTKAKHYRVQWRDHPNTGEVFEPQWVKAADVGDEAIADWEEVKRQRQPLEEQQEATGLVLETNTSRGGRQRKRPVISDSDSVTEEEAREPADNETSPPALISRGSSVSGVEILETQAPSSRQRFIIDLPEPPSNKSEYELARASQLDSQLNSYDIASPSAHLTHDSSQLGTLVSVSVNTASPLQAQKSTDNCPQTPTSDAPVNRQFGSDRSLRSRTGLLVEDTVVTKQAHRRQPSIVLKQLPESVESSSARDNSARKSPRSLQSQCGQSARPRAFAQTLAPLVFDPISDYQNRLDSSPIARVSNHIANRLTRRHTRSQNSSMDSSTNVAGAVASDVAAVPSTMQPEKLLDSTSNTQNEAVISRHAGELQDDDVFDVSFDPAQLQVHESIEQEPQSSVTSQSALSKGNSSQESLTHEHSVPSVDGIMIPTLPILGPHEYCFALPAEGKVKSIYGENLKAKQKVILRFLRRKGSPGTSEISSKKTAERNEIQQLLRRLHDTTTHIDLGLADMQTQYTPDSQHEAMWADYAGSKFVALGALIEQLKTTPSAFVIMAQPGQLQDLIENYLKMKHIDYRRQDRSAPSSQPGKSLFIDLLSTQSTEVVKLSRKPAFVIAFDATFVAQGVQMKAIREEHDPALPVIHFLVPNSSEHVERCVPESITSNLRLKIVIRTTYLAASSLGMDPSLVPDEETDGSIEELAKDVMRLQRAVKKSPNRRIGHVAKILADAASSGQFNDLLTFGSMPELQLDELIDTPMQASRPVSVTPQATPVRGRSPASRSGTPLARKRLLEIDTTVAAAKRQRLTPLQDSSSTSNEDRNGASDFSALQDELAVARSEAIAVRKELASTEGQRDDAVSKESAWRQELALLQGRYEERRKKTQKLESEVKRQTATIAAMQTRNEKSATELGNLRTRIMDLTKELAAAREELKAAGGDVAALELAREEARNATAKQAAAEKSLQSMKGDFEFMRNQYQDASKKAQDYALEVTQLQTEVEKLKIAADDKRRSLKSLNYEKSINAHIEASQKSALEARNYKVMIKRLQEENSALKNKRGVQTRGSSAQPMSSPGPRSRQGSPAPGSLQPPSGSRASVLRNER